MNVLIRADASIEQGTGHIMRCLTLAQELVGRGAEVYFICAKYQGNLIQYIQEKRNFRVHTIRAGSEGISSTFPDQVSTQVNFHSQNDADFTLDIVKQFSSVDWLIVDHYEIDKKWEKKGSSFVKNIFVIDDLANRPHLCDLLLDQNYYLRTQRYYGLTPENCILKLGPDYALLREEFLVYKKKIGRRSRNIKRVLISFGGTDPTNESLKALKALYLLKWEDVWIDVIVGSKNPNKTMIHAQTELMANTHFHCQVENMSELMSKADLAIGAGGITMWERCYLGLPSIVTILSSNQCEVIESVSKTGSIINLGWGKDVTLDDYFDCIKDLTTADLQQMSEASQNLVSGEGAIKIVNLMYAINSERNR